MKKLILIITAIFLISLVMAATIMPAQADDGRDRDRGDRGQSNG